MGMSLDDALRVMAKEGLLTSREIIERGLELGLLMDPWPTHVATFTAQL